MINPQEGLIEQQKVRLDWRAYWKEFSRNHGDYPQRWKGVLLFRDGWTYGMGSYEGPERPPPDDPTVLGKMVYEYWRLRRLEVRQLWHAQSNELEQLRDLQRGRSLPIMHSSVWLVRDEFGTAKRQRFEGLVDFDMMELEVDRLKEELDECERNLDGLVQPPELAAGTPQTAGK